jgi:hypothetical protein
MPSHLIAESPHSLRSDTSQCGAWGEEFAKLPWRLEGFGHFHLLHEAVFQVENMVQISIAGFPYPV